MGVWMGGLWAGCVNQKRRAEENGMASITQGGVIPILQRRKLRHRTLASFGLSVSLPVCSIVTELFGVPRHASFQSV